MSYNNGLSNEGFDHIISQIFKGDKTRPKRVRIRG